MEQMPFSYRKPAYVPNDPNLRQPDSYGDDEGMDFGMLGDIASGVGNLIDLPGSMVRDTISFSNPLDQLMTPFSSDNRTSGADISRYWAGGDADSGGNQIAGMMIDILTDPLMLASGGTLAAGKMGAKAAGSVSKGMGKVAGAAKSGFKAGKNRTATGRMVRNNSRIDRQASALEGAAKDDLLKTKASPESIAATQKAFMKSNPGEAAMDMVRPFTEGAQRAGGQAYRSAMGGMRDAYNTGTGMARQFGNDLMAGNRNALMQGAAIGTNAASTMGGLHRSQEPSIEEMIAQAIMEDPELGSQLLEILGVGQPQY